MGSEIKRWRWRRGRPLLGILPASVPTRATNEIQSASTLPAISMSLKLSIFTYSESKLSHVFPLFTVHCSLFVLCVLCSAVDVAVVYVVADVARVAAGDTTDNYPNLNAFYDDYSSRNAMLHSK